MADRTVRGHTWTAALAVAFVVSSAGTGQAASAVSPAAPAARKVATRRFAQPKPAPSATGRGTVAAAAVAYSRKTVRGVTYHFVQLDPRRRDVRLAVATAAGGPGAGQSWSGIIDRVRPTAALTGTHFSTTSLIPVGTLVSEGRRLHTGAVGAAFVYSPGKGAAILPGAYGRALRADGWDLMIRSGPRLLQNGRSVLWPAGEGFRDPGLFVRKRRAAVGITASGKVLLVATNRPILLRTLAEHVRRLGAVDAMALDGGSSAGLYHRGKSWVVPSRRLTNLLVVYDSAASYRRAQPRLTPGGWMA